MYLRKNIKILLIVLIALVVWTCFFVTDLVLVNNNKRPAFVIKTSSSYDGGSSIYYGIGYKVIDYNITNGYQGIHLGTWFMKFNPDKYYTSPIDSATDFTIIENAVICGQVLEKFYEDENYEYYFSCAKSGNVLINFGKHFPGGEMQVPVREALTKKYVTIEQLQEKGLKFSKKAKKINEISATTGFTIIDNSGMCAQSLEKFYEDENYEYYFSCIKSHSVLISFDKSSEKGEMQVPVKEALTKKYVTIGQLQEKGLKFYTKDKKTGEYIK